MINLKIEENFINNIVQPWLYFQSVRYPVRMVSSTIRNVIVIVTEAGVTIYAQVRTDYGIYTAQTGIVTNYTSGVGSSLNKYTMEE